MKIDKMISIFKRRMVQHGVFEGEHIGQRSVWMNKIDRSKISSPTTFSAKFLMLELKTKMWRSVLGC